MNGKCWLNTVINPYSTLLITSHCALRRNIVSAHLCAGSALAKKVGQGGVTHRVTCTWWLLGLAVKGHGWDHVGHLLPCMDRLRKHYSHLVEGWFLARKAAWALSRCMTTESGYYCMVVNEWVWSESRVCLLRLEVNLGSVLESELGQKLRYGALKACVC